jgi:predicted RNA-binding protein with PUA-like domain
MTLAAVKAEPKLNDMALVKYSRLSVQPVTAQGMELRVRIGGLIKGILSPPFTPPRHA